MESHLDFRIGDYYLPTDGTPLMARVSTYDIITWSTGAIYGNPLPVSEHILIDMFGFVKRNGGDYYLHLKSDPAALEFIFDRRESTLGLYSEFDEYGSLVREISFIHELQSIYYWTIGKELPVNNG